MPRTTTIFAGRTVASAVAVAFMVGGCVACTSSPVTEASGKGLPPGTARITLGDRQDDPVTRVQCATVNAATTIETGNGNSGTTALISNAAGLDVHLVRFNNVDGFSGAYTSDVGGDGKAEVTLTNATYDIRGRLQGTSESDHRRTTKDFRIQVSC